MHKCIKMHCMSQISDIIKSLRSAPINLSQAAISRETGIQQSRISRWGAGEGTSGANDALKLAALDQKLRKQPRKPRQAQASTAASSCT